MFRKILFVFLAVVFVAVLPACGKQEYTYTPTEGCTDYSNPENWAFLPAADDTAPADVFFIAPATAKGTDENPYNMVVSSEKDRSRIVGLVLMQKDIYTQNANLYVPYYRQMTMKGYYLPAAEREPYLAIAYADVREAFTWYLANSEEDRPFILVGFSQGADMVLRLMKEFFADTQLQERLVAAYTMGWHLTEAETAEYPYLVPATGETDTGVIILFEAEAEGITDSIAVPAGVKSYCINPLNWKTDATSADKSLNLGACFMNYDGTIKKEIPAYTGAYINTERGTLVCPDVNPDDYTASELFPRGVYHAYDYQFFYRNLQENVAKRLDAYMNKK